MSPPAVTMGRNPASGLLVLRRRSISIRRFTSCSSLLGTNIVPVEQLSLIVGGNCQGVKPLYAICINAQRLNGEGLEACCLSRTAGAFARAAGVLGIQKPRSSFAYRNFFFFRDGGAIRAPVTCIAVSMPTKPQCWIKWLLGDL
jgi:hypothetical protein